MQGVQREPLTRSPLKTHSSRRANACSSRTWLVHCGDQIGPVDIRGARPLHSGCCEAVLECAPHAVDSRIFGSTQTIPFNIKKVNHLYAPEIRLFRPLSSPLVVPFPTPERGSVPARHVGFRALSSAVERRIADPEVTGSIPVTPFTFFVRCASFAFYLPRAPRSVLATTGHWSSGMILL